MKKKKEQKRYSYKNQTLVRVDKDFKKMLRTSAAEKDMSMAAFTGYLARKKNKKTGENWFDFFKI